MDKELEAALGRVKAFTEPHDKMLPEFVKADLRTLVAAVERLQGDLRMSGDWGEEQEERAEKAEAALAATQERLAKAEKLLRPFAEVATYFADDRPFLHNGLFRDAAEFLGTYPFSPPSTTETMDEKKMSNELTIQLWDQTPDYKAIHPDPEIAREIVVQAMRGALTDAKNGLLRALDYRTVTPEGQAIRADVMRALENIQVPMQEWGYRTTA